MIQIELDGNKYFVFGFSTHANILDQYLQDKGVEFGYIEKTGKKTAAPNGPGYSVVGMGRCDIVPSRKLLFFSDESIDYELAVSKEYVDLLQSLNPGWKVSII